jgi:hypothetical protein
VRAINAADEDYDPRLLPEVAVLGWDTVAAAVDVLNVWPPIRPDDEESFFGSTIDLSIHLAGSLTVSSMCVEETDFVDLAPLRPALSGGQAPIARAVRQLYQRAHDQHLRTSIKTIGGQPDPTHIDRMARAVTTTGTIVPLEQLYVIDIPVYDAATTYKVTVQGVDYTAVGAGSAATTLLSLHSSIRLSAGNVAVDARILGAYLVLRPRSAYVISPTVNATGGTGTITNTATRRRTLGGVLITGYSDDAGVVDGDDSSASYRTKMEVAMLMAVCGPGGPADEVVEVFPVARLGSFNAGGWDGLEEYTSLGGVQLQCVKADEGLSRAWRVLHYHNSNINYAGEIPRQTARWHTLRGAIPLFAMRLDPPSGGVPFYTIVRGTVQDDEPEETHRLLRLYVDGVPWNVNESTNGAAEYLPRLLYCPAITVWGTEEVRP